MRPSSDQLVDNRREIGWMVAAVVMTVLETVFFALRIFCRWTAGVQWGADDYLAAIAYIAVIALNAVGIAITTDTWVGQHTKAVSDVDPNDVVLFLKLQLPLAITYICAATIPKMSIIALYIRIFIQKPFRIACWIVQTILILYFIAVLISMLATCVPFSANWALHLGPGEHCINVPEQYRALSIPNLITDVAIIALPIPVIWRMQKTTSEKFGMLGTFSLGLIGLAFSIARLQAFFGVFDGSDVLYTAAYTGIFTTLEPGSYFLVMCMMTFRRLLHLPIFQNCKRSHKSSHSGGSRSTGDSKLQQRWLKQSKGSAHSKNKELGTLSSMDGYGGSETRMSVRDNTQIGSVEEGSSGEGGYSGFDEVLNKSRRDSESGPDMSLHDAARELSRAHNRPVFPGVVTVSSDPNGMSALMREKNSSDMGHLQLMDNAEDSAEVLNAKAIGVKREVNVTRS